MHKSGSDNSSQIYGHSKFSNFPMDLVQPEVGPFDPPSPKTLPSDQTRSRSDVPFRRYGNLKFSKMAASRHLGFGPTGSRSIRSADLENPTLEPNMKWIGSPVAEIWPFEILQNARSVGRRVGRRSVGPQYYLVLIHSSTLR